MPPAVMNREPEHPGSPAAQPIEKTLAKIDPTDLDIFSFMCLCQMARSRVPGKASAADLPESRDGVAVKSPLTLDGTNRMDWEPDSCCPD